jgi:tripartite-type tricarboxylate transporter receptor subunit TctC
MHFPSRRDLIVGFATGALLSFSTRQVALAQSFPVRTVTLVCPFAAGGPADALARAIAEELRSIWSSPVIVENRTGAGGAIGTEAVVKAAADGYTLLLGTNSTFAVNPAVHRGLRFDVLRDLAMLGLIARARQVFVARLGLGARTLSEVVS